MSQSRRTKKPKSYTRDLWKSWSPTPPPPPSAYFITHTRYLSAAFMALMHQFPLCCRDLLILFLTTWAPALTVIARAVFPSFCVQTASSISLDALPPLKSAHACLRLMPWSLQFFSAFPYSIGITSAVLFIF